MYSFIIIVLLILSLASCNTQQTKTSHKIVENKINVVPTATVEKINSDKKELNETFTDETEIGVPGKNKIEISNFEKNTEQSLVEIKFYSLNKDKKWNLRQTLGFEKYGGMPINPNLEDFNNDGFKDITYNSSVAARGANELRKLLIYDKNKDELIPIANSEDYPNMQYNKVLNCIDAWLVYGATSTVFLKIEGNRLKEFARVDTGETRTVYLIDKNGKEKFLRKDKMKERDIYTRYKTFNPPRPY